MSALKSTAIYKELERRRDCSSLARKLIGQIDSALEDIGTYLNEIRRYYYHFTDHSLKHSERIIYYIGRLLRSEQLTLLTDTELFLFIAAALVHDIGMVVTDLEAQALRQDPKFQEERTRILSAMGIPALPDSNLDGVERLVVAEYMRRRHGERCTFVLSEDRGCIRQLTAGRKAYLKWIGMISVGHSLEFAQICDREAYPRDVTLESDSANIQFITICLRIGDLLDINTARADPILRGLSEPLSTLSRSHWEQYEDIEVRDLAPAETVTISGSCPSQGAERLLREWVAWLEDECERATLLMNTFHSQHSLAVGRIEYKVKPKTDPTGRPLYEFHSFRFNLDEERVFKTLFGIRLYGRPEAAIRELVQNAVDATRARIAYALSRSVKGWDGLSSEQKRHGLRQAINDNCDEHPITISCIRSVSHDGQTEAWLSVEDNGIGMSRECIERYLLQVGHSRWSEDPLVSGLGLGSIGEFGLGFLSTFMLSDRTVVETQSCIPDQEGIRATIYNWHGYLATEPLAKSKFGTKVSMLLKSDVSEAFENGLPALILRWCPFLELPIIVEDIQGANTRLASAIHESAAEVRNGICFRLSDEGSVAYIRGHHVYRDKAGPAPVSQDGISIPDMPPPILDTPAQSVLQDMGVRINLLGGDRLPLDLSRNLVKGGADDFWRRFVPMIWRGLVRNALGFKEARNALAEYVEQDFYLARGRKVFTVREGLFEQFSLGNLPECSSVQLMDAGDPLIASYIAESNATNIFLPAMPKQALIEMLEMDEADRLILELDQTQMSARESAAYYWRHKADILFPSYGRPGTFEGWFSSILLETYYPLLFEQYPYVRRGTGNLPELVPAKCEASIAVSSLGAWRLSGRWLAIMNPETHSPEAITLDEIVTSTELSISEFCELCGQLSVEQVVLGLMFILWPDAISKEPMWPNDTAGNAVSSHLYLAMKRTGFEKYKRAVDEAEFTSRIASEEDEDYLSTDADEETDDELPAGPAGDYELGQIDIEDEGVGIQADGGTEERLGYPDVRSHANLIRSFFNDVLPTVDSELVSRLVTPWDRQAWQEDQWGISRLPS